MHSDAFFRMGSTHDVCQDYADSGQCAGLVWAALSDGCSSSPNTDFGARIMVRSYFDNIQSVHDGWIVRDAERMGAALGLPNPALDATLLGLVSGTEEIWVYGAGDGVIVTKLRDGSVHYQTVAFEQNAPRYLNYRRDPERTRAYHDMVASGTRTIGTKEPGAAWLTADVTFMIGEFDPYLARITCDVANTEYVLLLSDGVESFVDAAGQSVPLNTVLDALLEFKGFSGRFMARRCKSFLDKACRDRGWRHLDDFSAVGIYTGATP